MIVRCHHLREAGIMTSDCCSHCHIHAGCCLFDLPNGHEAHLCCARTDSFTPEEIAVIVAWIPTWEKQEASILAPPAAPEISLAFRPAYQAIQHFEGDERYLAALIYGPIVRGDATEYSGMEVWMLMEKCGGVGNHRNYLILDGVRLCLIFCSLDTFYNKMNQEIGRRDRIQTISLAKSLIVFDKTRKLRRMQVNAQQEPRRSVAPLEKQRLQFLHLHYRALVASYMKEKPLIALYVMHECLYGLLMFQYQLHQRWWVGSHRVFHDLHHWDQELARLVEQFLAASNPDEKFQCWLAISEYVLRPLEDCPPAFNSFCSCDECRANLAPLLEK